MAARSDSAENKTNFDMPQVKDGIASRSTAGF